MKEKMKLSSPLWRAAKAVLFSSVVFSTVSVYADIVYVTARPTPSGAGANPSGAYFENLTLGDTSAAGTAPDGPPTSGSRYYAASAPLTNVLSGIDLFPTLGTPGAVYKIEHNFSSTAGNVNTNAIFKVACVSGGTLSVTNTDCFQRQFGNPATQWKTIGYVTNDVGSATPYISFTYESGYISAAAPGFRWLIDTFKFTLVEPCLAVATVEVVGPVAVGTTNVPVRAVSGSATAVEVYQDSGAGMVKIGEITSGIVAGTNFIPVSSSAIVKGAIVAATQTIGVQEGCLPTSGVIAGGGANPRLRVALSIREAPNATGPAGANGGAYTTNNSRIHFLGASTRTGGAPAQGVVVYPSNTWQTVTLQRGPDFTAPTNDAVIWNSGIVGQVDTVNDLQGDWGTIEAIAFTIDDLSDTGPYEIYIDNLKNGATVFEDFEAGTAGQVDFTFRQPSFSGTTSPNILVRPNVAEISTLAADGGTKSLVASWQWVGTNSARWLRFTTSGTTSGHPNPLVNLNDPISFRILMIPVGGTLPPVVVPPGAITVSLSGSNVELNWAGSFTLQSATDVSGPYTDVAGPVLTGPYITPATGPAKFYRLRSEP